MATRNKPYDSFGPFILFKKLETDALGDLWRAARFDSGQLGPALAVRRLSGGHRESLAASAHAAAEVVPQLTGASFVRGQIVGVADGLPFLAWEYQGGRSLRYIVDRARGANGVQAHPIPMDQAIVIAEKVALSRATTAELRDGAGKRLAHGALLPHFVWISDDGEIRVAGQLLSDGITASLTDQRVAGEIARYFAPESRGTQKNGEVYALGALLFLLVTGQEPPDAATASAFGAAVRAAKTMAGAPIPDDIRIILDKSFNIDPSMRYQSIADMKQALTALANGGKYSATTFNLAFYLSNLLKKEMEAEALDREKESKVNLAPYLEVSRTAPAQQPQAVAAASASDFSAPAEKTKSKAPLAIAASLAIALVGAGGYMMFKKTSAQPAATPAPVKAQTIPVQPKPAIISEPIVASGSPETATSAPATTDSAAQQKAFEDAVRDKMQAEMMKLQNQFMADLKKSQPKQAPVTIAPAAVAASEPEPERNVPSAAQLDQQRRETRQETTSQAAAVVPQPAPVQTQTVAPAQPQVVNTQTAAPAPARAPVVREGDVVNVTDLDAMPKPIRVVTPLYPPMARSQRLAAVILVSAFINENGQVTDVKVLRGEQRYGLSDAAVRAMRATRFTPPMKDGRKVKTWFPQQIEFRP